VLPSFGLIESINELIVFYLQCGGAKRMEECYMMKLKNMENDPDVIKEQLLMRMERVATVL
jgi:hypothetical protein